MLETYDPKWAEKNDHAQAEYQRLDAIPLHERTADDHARMKALAAVQGLSFMAQFKTPNAYIRFHYDTLYKNLLRQYGEVSKCPELPNDAGFDEAEAIVRAMSDRIETLQLEAGMAEIETQQAGQSGERSSTGWIERCLAPVKRAWLELQNRRWVRRSGEEWQGDGPRPY